MEFGLVRYSNSNTNIYGYVRYVIPNSSAGNLDVKRGMIFNSVNGTQLTDANYTNLLFSNSTTITIGLADFNAGNPIANNTSIELVKTQVQENPIAISKVITEGNKKIGYLMYNQFASSYDVELNAVFNNFKSENINDLIIDLRYNGGGATSTAAYLGAMVTGQFTDQVYSKEVWNDKVLNAFPSEDFINNFPDRIQKSNGVNEAINSLGLQSVYFIVSGSSASASELVINSLSAYIDVKVVGATTVGKQVGSITLYDSDNLFKSGANLNTKHTYAMQPLVFEITNKNYVNYPNGITPGTNIEGIQLRENIGNLGVLGERSDPLLDRTLTYITTGAKPFSKKENFINSEEIFNSKLSYPSKNNMIVDFKNHTLSNILN